MKPFRLIGPCAILGFVILVRRGACMHAAKEAYDDGMIALSEALSEFMLPFGKNSGLVSLDLIIPNPNPTMRYRKLKVEIQKF